jgi:uncharacterized protein (TIGR03435 family)
MYRLKPIKNSFPGVGRLAATAAIGLALTANAHAQLLHPPDGKPPSFEVVTIKPSHSAGDFVNYHISSDRFKAENATLTALIRFAYAIKSDDQLPSEPKWIGSEKFDIDAKIEDSEMESIDNQLPEQKLERYRWMVQSLLADRFKLKVVSRTKVIEVYALVVAKKGPKMTPAKGPPESQTQRVPTLSGGSRGELKAGAVSMAVFAEWLSGKPDTGNRGVVDETGLKGNYDFTLNWTPDNVHLEQFNGAGTGPANVPQPSTSGPSILTALQEQLGLKLEQHRAPVDILLIDHVEHPTPN